MQPHHIVAFGLTLSGAALYERLRGGRAYALCDEPPLLGRLTTVALCLVLAAAVTAVVGAWVAQEKAPRHRAVPWVFIAVIAALTRDGGRDRRSRGARGRRDRRPGGFGRRRGV